MFSRRFGQSCAALPLFLSMIAVGVAPDAVSATPAPDVLLDAMVREVDRTMTSLSAAPEPPYWMALAVVDRHDISLAATHGATSLPAENRVRMGDVDIRVGDWTLDNTHKIRDAGWFDEPDRFVIELPLEDDPAAIQRAIWKATDDTYRSAVRRLIKVRTNDAVKVEREDSSADFSPAPAVVDVAPVSSLAFDPAPWQDVLRRTSARFLDHPKIYDSNVTLNVHEETHTLVTTDGTRIRQHKTHARIAVWATTTAEDGQQIEVYDHIDTAGLHGLPDEATLTQMVDSVAQKVDALRDAPIVDPYVGPAILRGRAAGVFFHEILGHRAEGHRQKDEDEGQTLTDKVGERVFPTFISVSDDPTRAEWGGVDLNGHYRFDDEGVAAQKVTIIDHGILRSFLMSRAPIAEQDVSNGHGRRQPGNGTVARQGNLIIEAEEGVPYAQLRQQLIDRVKAEGKPFGLIFDDITGGFTLTGRGTPNSYAVQPVTVWRVWPDGRPDELVRGVDLIGTPLLTFDRIVAASTETDVFNGSCGAESGWVPVSAIAPDLLISELEVQRREKQNDRPPLLPPPSPTAASGGER